jgi:predicted phosphoribosyltransferase
MTIIQNRKVAGQRLAEKIYKILKEEKPIVLAIPRGGVVVGEEIAKKLNCSLDVIISKKITPPSSPEYAIGAITHDGTIYYGQSWNNFSQEPNFDEEISKKKLEVKRRLEEYRGTANYKFNNNTVILVDDGIATGATVFVLLKWLSEKKVKRIILAVPVIPRNTYEEMKPLVDSIVALEIPVEFYAVGQFYKEFDQVSDKEVMTILNKFKNPKNVDNGIS